METFERLVADAEGQPFSGWDFSYLKNRYEEGEFSWDIRKMLLESLRHSRSLLDLGTGGGEFLSSLQPLPRTTCATEGYAPNARIARRKLQPLGVDVVQTFCEDNGGPSPQKGALPFRANTFDCVMDRHEAYIANEVYRVLKRQGVFITQQVGHGNNAELHDFLQEESEKESEASWNFRKAVVELEAVGFRVMERRAESTKSRFLDIAAIVYYLTFIPWEVPGFSTKKYDRKLREIDRRIRSDGFFEVSTARFFVIAVKEAGLSSG